MAVYKRTTNKKTYAKKKRTVAKKHLTKTQIVDTRKIAKQVIRGDAETKYFNTTRLSTLTRIQTIAARSLATAVEVRAFAVGTGNNPTIGGNDVIDYGFVAGTGNPDVIPLNMTRAFGVGNGDLSLRKNAIDGAYVSPSMSQTEWIIQFPDMFTNTDLGRIAAANPMYMRMIRVTPRLKNVSDVEINPKGDLFVDQFGEAIGVNSGGFNNMELQLLQVNKRKYDVIQDLSKILVPSSTKSTFAISTGNTQITNLSKTGSRCKIVMKYKQPKKLYYTDVDSSGVVVDTAQPHAGQSNELIFFHFTTIGSSGNVNATGNIEITCKTVGTFKDI